MKNKFSLPVSFAILGILAVQSLFSSTAAAQTFSIAPANLGTRTVGPLEVLVDEWETQIWVETAFDYDIEIEILVGGSLNDQPQYQTWALVGTLSGQSTSGQEFHKITCRISENLPGFQSDRHYFIRGNFNDNIFDDGQAFIFWDTGSGDPGNTSGAGD